MAKKTHNTYQEVATVKWDICVTGKSAVGNRRIYTREEEIQYKTECLPTSEQLSCQEYHLCHYGVSYKGVNLDLIVRKLSNSVQMSARVMLLFRICKDCLEQQFSGFWKIKLPFQESLMCMSMWEGRLDLYISEFPSETKTTCVKCALCAPAREVNIPEKIFTCVNHTERYPLAPARLKKSPAWRGRQGLT